MSVDGQMRASGWVLNCSCAHPWLLLPAFVLVCVAYIEVSLPGDLRARKIIAEVVMHWHSLATHWDSLFAFPAIVLLLVGISEIAIVVVPLLL